MGIIEHKTLKCDLCDAEIEYSDEDRNTRTGWHLVESNPIGTHFIIRGTKVWACPKHKAVVVRFNSREPEMEEATVVEAVSYADAPDIGELKRLWQEVVGFDHPLTIIVAEDAVDAS